MLLHIDDQLVDMFKISLYIVYVHKYAHCKGGRCSFYNLNNIYIYTNLMEHQGMCMFPGGIRHFLSCGFFPQLIQFVVNVWILKKTLFPNSLCYITLQTVTFRGSRQNESSTETTEIWSFLFCNGELCGQIKRIRAEKPVHFTVSRCWM